MGAIAPGIRVRRAGAGGWLSGIAVVAGLCVACVPGGAEALPFPRVLYGQPTSAYPTAGMVLMSSTTAPINTDNAASHCSGVLVGCRSVVTAAHCFHGDKTRGTQADAYFFYLQHGGLFPVASIELEPGYTTATDERKQRSHDVAVITLAGEGVDGVQPSRMNLLHSPQESGWLRSARVVGFGQIGGGVGYGIKRVANVTSSRCEEAFAGPNTNAKLICTKRVGATDPGTCHGDSGGPLFMNLGFGTMVAGTVSGAASLVAPCVSPEFNFASSFYYHASFVSEHVSSTGASCGRLPPAGSPGTSVHAFDGRFEIGGPRSFSHEFALAQPAERILVTINAQNDSISPPNLDADLYVKAGAGADRTHFDCKKTAASSFDACAIADREETVWSLLVDRPATGYGDYQVTATAFYGRCYRPCGSPISGSPDAPKSSDALGVLRCAVGSGLECHPCESDVNGKGIAASDALAVLRSAVGSGPVLVCPACSDALTEDECVTTTTTSTSTTLPLVPDWDDSSCVNSWWLPGSASMYVYNQTRWVIEVSYAPHSIGTTLYGSEMNPGTCEYHSIRDEVSDMDVESGGSEGTYRSLAVFPNGSPPGNPLLGAIVVSPGGCRVNRVVVRDACPCSSEDPSKLCNHNVCYSDLRQYCVAVGS